MSELNAEVYSGGDTQSDRELPPLTKLDLKAVYQLLSSTGLCGDFLKE